MVAYSLVIVGAHNGVQSAELVTQRAARGPVLLVEPVPYLFAELAALHADNAAVTVLNAAITEDEVDRVAFYAPRREATAVVSFGDQLGSLNPAHATAHHSALRDVVDRIEVPAETFRGLTERYAITDIDLLVTDTEGHDAALLANFPFENLRPRHITFEFKHSDGVFTIGRRFAELLITLADNGYRTTVLDVENCLATRQD